MARKPRAEALGLAMFFVLSMACASTPPEGPGSSAGGSGAASGVALPALREVYADSFPVGAAVSRWHLQTVRDLLTTHFNHLTAENAMKFGVVQPAQDAFSFAEADEIAALARKEGMKMTGHAFVWHRQVPDWLFEDLAPGEAASIETLKARLKRHIEALVDRYGDVVDNWDVVNEAISDDPTKTYRDASEGSGWHEVFGSQDYIYWAFKYAHDALEARAPGSAKGKLYYNDYNVTLKVDRILQMASWLKEKGVDLDGVGFQAHYQMDWPSVAEIATAMNKFIAAGLKIKISELDITIYNDYPGGTFKAAPEVEFTPALEAEQAARYAELFELFRSRDRHITSVTTWGVSDDQTWLDHDPVPGRNNHPLLWNDDHQPRPPCERF